MLLVTSGALLLAITLAMSVFAAVSDRRSSHLSMNIQALEVKGAIAPTTNSKQSPASFVEGLNSRFSNDDVLRSVQRAADDHAAQMISSQSDEHVAATDTLGHLDLAVSLRGAYPSVVTVLADVLDRFPGATLKQLTLVSSASLDTTSPSTQSITTVSGPSSADRVCDARVTFSFWSRPLQTAVTPVR